MAEEALHQTDHRFLEGLQEQGDITNRVLAAAVGLSRPPCLKRVRRLWTAGVITKTVVLLDPDKIGQGLVAFVDFELEKQREDQIRLFEQRVAEQPEILQW